HAAMAPSSSASVAPRYRSSSPAAASARNASALLPAMPSAPPSLPNPAAQAVGSPAAGSGSSSSSQPRSGGSSSSPAVTSHHASQSAALIQSGVGTGSSGSQAGSASRPAPTGTGSRGMHTTPFGMKDLYRTHYRIGGRYARQNTSYRIRVRYIYRARR